MSHIGAVAPRCCLSANLIKLLRGGWLFDDVIDPGERREYATTPPSAIGALLPVLARRGIHLARRGIHVSMTIPTRPAAVPPAKYTLALSWHQGILALATRADESFTHLVGQPPHVCHVAP
eukprot:scaffold10242_cov19-Tisochrysis_lutea.AAC.2